MTDEFEDIYEMHSDKVYSYIFLLVRNRETSEDLTQETFIKAYRNIKSFRKESSIYTWLIQIARNTVFDFHKKKRLKQLFSFQKEEVNTVTPQEIVLKGEEIKLLYEGITTLKIEYQEVIILRKIKELSISETANILGWDEVKVKNTTARAMAALKKSLVEKGGYVYERRSEH